MTFYFQTLPHIIKAWVPLLKKWQVVRIRLVMWILPRSSKIHLSIYAFSYSTHVSTLTYASRRRLFFFSRLTRGKQNWITMLYFHIIFSSICGQFLPPSIIMVSILRLGLSDLRRRWVLRWRLVCSFLTPPSDTSTFRWPLLYILDLRPAYWPFLSIVASIFEFFHIPVRATVSCGCTHRHWCACYSWP